MNKIVLIIVAVVIVGLFLVFASRVNKNKEVGINQPTITEQSAAPTNNASGSSVISGSVDQELESIEKELNEVMVDDSDLAIFNN